MLVQENIQKELEEMILLRNLHSSLSFQIGANFDDVSLDFLPISYISLSKGGGVMPKTYSYFMSKLLLLLVESKWRNERFKLINFEKVKRLNFQFHYALFNVYFILFFRTKARSKQLCSVLRYNTFRTSRTELIFLRFPWFFNFHVVVNFGFSKEKHKISFPLETYIIQVCHLI